MSYTFRTTDKMPKLSCAWTFADKFYGAGTEDYRSNHERIFGKGKQPTTEEPSVADPGDEHDGPEKKILFVGPFVTEHWLGQQTQIFGEPHRIVDLDRGKQTITVVKIKDGSAPV